MKYLNQESYKDDNGHPVPASAVQVITAYKYIVDGFYEWACASCGHDEASRACGWPISGQVLECKQCHTKNLLVKTATDEIDAAIGAVNANADTAMRLERDRAAFKELVEQEVKARLEHLRKPLEAFLSQV